ncbi:MAG: Fumble domain-containing protein [Gemmatimonadetes bacterium]|nr:Fumble domain-containing protein [Gemmatimonadota bacterium]
MTPLTVPVPPGARPVAGIDFGSTNVDVVMRTAGEDGPAVRHWTLPQDGDPDEARVREVLAAGDVAIDTLAWVAVTGGNRTRLPAAIGACTMHQVHEVQAIGRGGLALAGVDAALVTSAGSGTAVVAATRAGSRHVTGTGVGGGTLVGLSRLLAGTADAPTIDALAQAGRDAAVNLTLEEVLGGAIGPLPPDTTAVNFGRVARRPVEATPADMAAALVNMVGQVIAVIAINAARAERLETIVVVGHLTDLVSVRRTLQRVGEFYGAPITTPGDGGAATALGALLLVEEAKVNR